MVIKQKNNHLELNPKRILNDSIDSNAAAPKHVLSVAQGSANTAYYRLYVRESGARRPLIGEIVREVLVDK